MRKSVILLTSLLLIIGVAASASAGTGVVGFDYTLQSSTATAYGSVALTDKIKVGGEYSGLNTGSGELRCDILYEATGDGLSTLDIGAGVSATTPIKGYLVLQGKNYLTTKVFLHTSVAYKITPAPTELTWGAGVGYDLSDTMYTRVTYTGGAIAIGVGLQF